MGSSLVIKIKKPSHSLSYYIDRILVYSFFALTLFIFLFNNSSFFYNLRFALLAVAAVRGYYIAARKGFGLPWILALFFGLNFLLCLIFQESVNLSTTNFLYTICYIGLAALLLKESYGLFGSGIMLIACAGIIVIRYALGVDPNNLLTTTSRNFISVLLLLVLILFYLALYKSGKMGYLITIIPALAYFLICVVAYGRGGILASAFLFAVLCVYMSFETQYTWRRRGLRLITFVVLLLVVAYLIFSDQITLFLGKFNVSANDEARLSFWTTFFKNNFSSWRNFLFGSDATLVISDGNLHNSFLLCYARYGLIPFITVIVMCIRSFIQGLKGKDYFIVILMATLFIRAFTDAVFFQGYCEVFLFYFLMYWEYKKLNYQKRRTLQAGFSE